MDNCCYFAATPDVTNTQGTWTEDSQYCQTTYGEHATLPTFETEAQFSWLVQNVGGSGWVNIRSVDLSFQMLGGSPSTYWKEKWEGGSEPTAADGLVVYISNTFISAAAVAISRGKIICMVFAGDA